MAAVPRYDAAMRDMVDDIENWLEGWLHDNTGQMMMDLKELVEKQKKDYRLGSSEGEPFTLRVRNMSGDPVCEVVVRRSWLGRQVQAAIQDTIRIPSIQQVLLIQGQQLEDDERIETLLPEDEDECDGLDVLLLRGPTQEEEEEGLRRADEEARSKLKECLNELMVATQEWENSFVKLKVSKIQMKENQAFIDALKQTAREKAQAQAFNIQTSLEDAQREELSALRSEEEKKRSWREEKKRSLRKGTRGDVAFSKEMERSSRPPRNWKRVSFLTSGRRT